MISTLRIVPLEKFELTFTLVLYLNGSDEIPHIWVMFENSSTSC